MCPIVCCAHNIRFGRLISYSLDIVEQVCRLLSFCCVACSAFAVRAQLLKFGTMPLSNHTHRRRRAKQLEITSSTARQDLADGVLAAQAAALHLYAERHRQSIESENFAIELQREEALRAQRETLSSLQACVPKRA